MAQHRPWHFAVRLIIVSAMLLLIATTAIAAPGPLKGVSTTVEPTEQDDDEDGGAAATEAAGSADRLDFQALALTNTEAGEAKSYRASVGSRTAEGSSGLGDAEAPPAAPEVDQDRRAPAAPADAEFARRPYQIVESGRPRQSTDSVLAYDGDETTSWSAGSAAPQAYAWFDLGEARQISGLRWFQTVTDGSVAIQISNDRENWETVIIQEQPIADEWQRAVVGERARYVRLVVQSENRPPDVAEIQIFGPPGSEPEQDEPVQVEQATTADRPPHVQITGGGEQGRQAAEDVVVVTPEPDSEAVEITVNGRRATCRGGERCRVETPRPDVVEDCGDGTTTCTIRVGMSGGVAVCDSSGGSQGRSGRDPRKGGNCTADASGGTVEISDVNR